MSLKRIIARAQFFKRDKCTKTNTKSSLLKKITAGLTGASFLFTSNFLHASQITAAYDNCTNISKNDNVYDITSNRTKGSNAFNAFENFNLSANDIANLHLPDNTSNLINFVNSRIEVNGTLNAIKNNEIGGNLYFLSSQGLVVGSGGVINTGAFFAMTPTEDFMNKFMKENTLLLDGHDSEIGHITSRKFVNHNDVTKGDGIPLNSDGSIIISGQINARDDIGLYSGGVVNDNGGVIINNSAQLVTGVQDFSSVVNTHGIDDLQVDNLQMTDDGEGNISIVSVADNTSNNSAILDKVAGFTQFETAEAHARVEVDGEINAANDANFEAVVANGVLDDIDETFVEYGEPSPLKKFADSSNISEIKAEVNFGENADVQAGNDINAHAVAYSYYKSGTSMLDLGLGVLGMATPINIDADVSIAKSDAQVNVAQGAELTAQNDVNLLAESELDLIVGASTSFAKIRQTPPGLSAGASYVKADNSAKVNVDGIVTSIEGDIDIKAIADAGVDVTASAKTANDNAILVTAAVIADIDNSSVVEIDENAVINSKKDLSVKAKAINDISSVAMAQAGDESYVTAAVNVTEFDSSAAVNINADLISQDGDVNIDADNLILQKTLIAENSVGHTKTSKAFANAKSNLASALFSFAPFASGLTGKMDESTRSSFSAAGAVLFTTSEHISEVNIGENIDIQAQNDLTINASTKIEDFVYKADSISRSKLKNADDPSKTSISAAVIYSDVEIDSTVNVGQQSLLQAETISVNSSAVVEYNRIDRMIQRVKDAVDILLNQLSGDHQKAQVQKVADAWNDVETSFGQLGADDLTFGENLSIFMSALGDLGGVGGALADLVMTEVGVVLQAAQVVTSAADLASYNNFFNVTISSSVKGDKDDDIGFAGTVGLINFNADSHVNIGQNVDLISTIDSGSDSNAIEIDALTDVHTLSVTGHLIPSSGSSSFGGTYLSNDFESSAIVNIMSDANIDAGVGNLEMGAVNNSTAIVIGLSTSMAGKGIEGMVARLAGESVSQIEIDDDVIIDAQNIGIYTENNTTAVNFAGAVMISSSVGVSAGLAINDFVRESQILIGAAEFNAHSMDISARSTGEMTAIGVAGGITYNDDSDSEGGFLSGIVNTIDGVVGQVTNLIDAFGLNFEGVVGEMSSKTDMSDGDVASKPKKNPQFSLSVSGSTALNLIENNTRVEIKSATLNLADEEDSNLNIAAVNSSGVGAYAGSAGIMWQTAGQSDSQSSKSVGIAGAVGLNLIDNTTEVILEDSIVNSADNMNVFALNGNQNVAAGLGMQLSANSGNEDGAYTLGGSVSINLIDNQVNATLKNTDVTGGDNVNTDINLSAYDSSVQVTGGVQVTVGKQKGAIGAAVNVSNINNNISSQIIGGTYSKTDDITLSALQALTQVSGALTTGIVFGTDDSVSIMGAVIYNSINNQLHAVVDGADINSNKTLSLNTRDFSKQDAVEGFEEILDKSDSRSSSFMALDGADYYDVDVSIEDEDGIEKETTPLSEQDKNGALIVSGAFAMPLADTAIGAGVIVTNISNDFISEVRNSNVQAKNVFTDSKSDTFLINAAGGVAVSTDNAAGGGSVVWNNVNNTVKADFVNSQITAENVKALSDNSAKITAVAGQIAAGAGHASVGMALTYNNIDNSAFAGSHGSSFFGANDSSDLLLQAQNSSQILSIAGSAAVSEKVGIGGSVNINKINTNSLVSFVDQYINEEGQTIVVDNVKAENLENALFKANDDSVISSIAGQIAGGGKAGIGGAVAWNEIGGQTKVILDSLTIDAENVEASAINDATIWTLSAGIGAAGKVAVQGAVSTGKIERDISAQLKDVIINNSQTQLNVASKSTGAINSLAAVIAAAGNVGVGAGVSVNRISDDVAAFIDGGNYNLKNVQVRSEVTQEIKTIGAAGSGGGSAGVSGSVGFNRIYTDNSAYINNATVNALNNIGVVAQTDDTLFNYAGALAVGGSAGVGAATAINYILGDTQAYIIDSEVSALAQSGSINTNSLVDEDKIVDAYIDVDIFNTSSALAEQRTSASRTGIVVDSSATHTLKSFVVNIAGAGSAALAGTVNVNQITGSTVAHITDSLINENNTESDVTINAADYTNCSSIVGSVAGAGAVGIGAAVDTNNISRDTRAYLKGAQDDSNASELSVNATAKQGLSSAAAGIGVAGKVAVAGTVSVANVSGETEAYIDNSNIDVDQLHVEAAHLMRSHVNTNTAAVAGFAGVGGSVSVVNNSNTVNAYVQDSIIGFNSPGDATVIAVNRSYSNTLGTAVCGGLVGVAGNVAVNYMENDVFAGIINSELGTSTDRAGSINVKAENSSTIKADLGTVAVGGVGAGASVGVITLDGRVRTEVEDSKVYTQDDIDIKAIENRTVDQRTLTVAGGVAAVGGNVMVVSAGQKLSEDDEDGNTEILNAVEQAEEVNHGSIEDENNVLTEEELAALNGAPSSLSASEAGRSATTVSIANSIIDSQNQDIDIKALENTNVDMLGGGATGGAVAAGGSVGVMNVHRNLAVFVNDSTIKSGGDVSLNSLVEGMSEMNLYQGSVGAVGLSAAYGRINATGNAVTSVADSTIQSQSDLIVMAADDSNAKLRSYGLSAGSIAAGVLINDIRSSGSTNVNLSNNELTADDNIHIAAKRSNELDAKTVGGAVGITYSGNGIVATIEDEGTAAVTMTGSKSELDAQKIKIEAENKIEASGEATSVAVSGIASAGVSYAKSDLSGVSDVFIGNNNSFNSSNLVINSFFDGTNDVESVGVSGAFLGSFGYNQSSAVNNARVKIQVGDNQYQSSTDISINADNVVNQSAETRGLNVGGLLASGNNKAVATSDSETEVVLAGGAGNTTVNSIEVISNSSSIHDVKADGRGGGLISVDGLSAYAISDITSQTSARIGGKWNVNNNVDVLANHYNNVQINADSTRAALAGYSGTQSLNEIDSFTDVSIAQNSDIFSNDSISFEAKNMIEVGKEGSYSASGGGYGGIVVNGARGIANINAHAEVVVEENSSLSARNDIVGAAFTEAEIYNQVKTTGAGVVSNPLTYNVTDINFKNNLIVADNAYLETRTYNSDVTLVATDNTKAVITSDANMQGGLGGKAYASTKSTITKNNDISVNGQIFSTNDINLFTDANTAGRRSFYDLFAAAYAYNKHSAVAIATADIDSSTVQNNRIVVGSDAELTSVRHINLGATQGRERTTEESQEYTWHGSDSTGDYSATSPGGRSRNTSGENSVEIKGTLIAGIFNVVNFTIDGLVNPEGSGGTIDGSISEPIVDSTVERYENELSFGILNYGNELFERYIQISEILANYEIDNGNDPHAVIGYRAEQQRIRDEMETRGLYEDGAPVGELLVNYIELPEMVSSGGNIVINASNVKGNGSITAQGSPQINIVNNTNLYTRINDLHIADYGGEVIYNDTSLGSRASEVLSSLSHVETQDPGEASINITQDWTGGAISYTDDTGDSRSYTPMTTIEITGEVSNPLGIINVDNKSGDILIQGESATVTGREIHLSATGSVTQGYSDSIVNIGGTPEHVYGNKYYNSAANNSQFSTNNIDLSKQNGTRIAGGSIFINASDINVNGLIQSGYDDYFLDLGSAAQSKIQSFDDNYRGQNITSLSNYAINSGGSKFVSGKYVYEVQAYYNPQTRQIILEDIDPQGGRIYLTGRISSTGNGRIFAADGSADININSTVSREIVAGKVAVGDRSGLISITDTANNMVAEFRRDSTTIYNIDSSPDSATVTGASDKYSPISGLYYNWSHGIESVTYADYARSVNFRLWGGWTTSSSLTSNHSTEQNKISGGTTDGTEKLTGTYIGQMAGAEDRYTVFNDHYSDFRTDYYRRWRTYSNFLRSRGTRHYRWGYTEGTTTIYQHSLKADHDISIGFLGSSNGGSIDFAANNNITLNSDVTGTDGTSINIESKYGSISQSAGRIIGDDVTLKAARGIGADSEIDHMTIGDDALINASSDSGHININSVASTGQQGNIQVKALTNNGNISIKADGNIVGLDTGLSARGDRIDLVSRRGGIGTDNSAFLIQASPNSVISGDTMSASVNASADQSINITQNDGDMRLGRVESDFGDVKLTVNDGSFVNVLPVTEDNTEAVAAEKIQRWIELGIIAEDGSDNGELVRDSAVESYELGIKSQFANYITQRDLYAENPDLQECNEHGNGKGFYEQLHERFQDFASAQDYLDAAAGDSEHEYYQIKNNIYGWSQDSLLYALQRSIINPESGSSQTLERPANVKGRNITLIAANGGIGTDEEAEVVSLENIGSNIESLKKLATAEATDVTWDEENAIATIERTTPIGIEMTHEDGVFNALANNNIYINGATDDPIFVDNLNANESNIRLLARNGIFSLSSEENTANFKAHDLILEGGDSGIDSSLGTADTPLKIDVSGWFTARSDGLINVEQIGNNPLNISAIYGAQDVTIKAANDLLSVYSGIQAYDLGYINAGGILNLTSVNGNIGASGEGVRILGDRASQINAFAENIYIVGETISGADTPLRMGDIIARDNFLSIVSEDDGVSFLGEVDADEIDLKVVYVNQDTESSITSEDLTVEADEGVVLSGESNEISNISITNNVTGNIELNNRTAITIKALSNFGASAGSIILDNIGDIIASSIIQANEDILIDSTGGFDSDNSVIAGQNVVIIAENTISAVSVQGSDDVELLTNEGDVFLTSNLISGANAKTQTTTGNIEISDVNVTNNYTISTENGAINIDDISVGEDLDLSLEDGELNITDMVVGGNADLDITNGHSTFGTVDVKSDFTFDSKNGNISFTQLDVGNDFALTSTDGDIESNKTTVGNDFTLNNTTGDITLTELGVGNDFALTSTDGIIDSDITTVGNDFILDSTNGDVKFGQLDVTQDMTFDNTNGNINGGDIKVGRDLTLTSSEGNIDVTDLEVGNDFNFTSSEGDIDIADLDVGNDFELESEDGDLDITDMVVGNDADLNITNGHSTFDTADVASDFTFNSQNGNISFNQLDVGHDFDLTSIDGDIESDKTTVGNDFTLNNTTGDITLSELEVCKDFALTSTDGIIDSDITTVGKDFTLHSTNGDIRFGQLNVTQDMTFANTYGNINGGDIEIGRNLTLTSSEGDIDVTNLEVGNDFNFTSSEGDIDIVNLDVGNDFELESEDGDLDITDMVVGNNADLDITNGHSTFGTADVGSDFTFNSHNGNISFNQLDVGNDFDLTSIDGSISSNITTVDNDFNLNNTTGDITLTELGVGSNFALTSTDGDIDSDKATVGNDFTLNNTTGDIALSELEVGNDFALTSTDGIIDSDITTVGNDFILDSTNGDVRFGQLDVTQDMTFTNTNGNINGGDIKVGRDLTLTSSKGNIDVTDLEVGNDFNFTSSEGDIDIVNLDVGNDFELESEDGDLDITDMVVGNDADLDITNGHSTFGTAYVGADFTFNSENGNISFTQLDVGNDFELESEDGDLDITDMVVGNDADLNITNGHSTFGTADVGSDFTFNSQNGNISFNQLDVGNDFALTSTDGDIESDKTTVGNDFTFNNTTGDITLSELEVGNDFALTSVDGDIKSDEATVGNDFTLNNTTGDITLTELGVGNNFALTSTDGIIDSDITTVGNDFTLNSINGDIRFGQLDVTRDMTFDNTNGDINGGDIEIGRDLTLTNSEGDIDVTNLEVGNDFNFTSSEGDIDVVNLDVGHDFELESEDGDLDITDMVVGNGADLNITNGHSTFGTADVGSDFTFNSQNGNISFNQLDVGNDFDLTSIDGTINSNITTVGEDFTLNNTTGNITLTELGVGNNFALTSTDGIIDSDITTVGNDFILNSINGDIRFGQLDVTRDMTFTNTNGDINGGDIEIGRDLTLTNSEGDIDVTNLEVGNDFDFTSSEGDIDIVNLDVGNDFELESEDGDLDITDMVVGNNADLDITNGHSTFGTADVGSDFTFNSHNGNISFNQLDVGNDFDLTSIDGDIESDKTTVGNDFTFNNTTGDITLTELGVGNNFALTSTDGIIDSDITTVGNDFTLNSINGDIRFGQLDVTQDMTFTNTNGDINGGDFEVGRDLTLTSSEGDIDVTNLEVGNDFDFTSSEGDIDIVNLDVGNDFELESEDGDLDITDMVVGNNADLDITNGHSTFGAANVGSDFTFNSRNGNISFNQLDIGNDFELESEDGDLDITDMVVGNNAGFDITNGHSTFGAANVGSNFSFNNQNGNISFTQLDVGNDFDLTSIDGTINSNITTVGVDFTLNNTTGDITLSELEVGNDFALTSVDGDIKSDEATVGNDFTLNNTTGDITLTELGVGNNFALTSTDGIIDSDITTVGNDFTLNSINGDIRFGQLDVTRDMTFDNTNGNINGDDVYVGRDLTLTSSEGNIDVTDLEVGNNFNFTSSEGDIDIANLDVGNDFELESDDGNLDITDMVVGNNADVDITNGHSTFGTANVGSDFTFNNQNGNISFTQLDVGNDFALTSIDGTINSNITTVGEDFTLNNTTGDITLSELEVGNDFALTSTDGDIESDKMTVGNDFTFNNTTGDITLTELGVGNNFALTSTDGIIDSDITTVGNDFTLNSINGDIRFGQLDVTRDMTFDNTNGDINGDDVYVGRDLTLTSSEGDIDVTDLEVGNNFNFTSSEGDIDIANLDVGNDFELESDDGNLDITDMVVGNNADVDITNGHSTFGTANVGSDFTFNNQNGNISFTQLDVGNDFALTSTDGDIESDKTTVGNDFTLNNTTGDITLTELSVGNNFALTSTDGIIDSYITTVGNDFMLNSTNGDIRFGQLDVTQDMTFDNTNGNINGDDVYVGRDLTLTSSEGNIDVTDLEVGSDFTFTSSEGDIDIVNLDVGNDFDLESEDGDLDITDMVVGNDADLNITNGHSTFGTADVGSDFTFNSQNGNISFNQLDVGNDFALTSTDGDIESDKTTVGNDFTFNNTTGNIALTDLEVGNDFALTSTDGDIESDKMTVGNDFTFNNTTGDITLTELGVGNNFALTSTDGNIDSNITTVGNNYVLDVITDISGTLSWFLEYYT